MRYLILLLAFGLGYLTCSDPLIGLLLLITGSAIIEFWSKISGPQ